MENKLCEQKWLIENTEQVMIRHCNCCHAVHVRVGASTLSFTTNAFLELAGVLGTAAKRVLESENAVQPERFPLVAAQLSKSRH